MKKKLFSILILIATNVVTAALVAAFVIFTVVPKRSDKLSELKNLIMTEFVDECDETELEDAAAAAMVAATGDRWSYYIPADQYQELVSNYENSGYVGVGITISQTEEGVQIVSLEPNGPAAEAGIEPEDYLVGVDGTDVTKMTTDEVADLVQGEENTQVTLKVRRGDETLEFKVTRRAIEVVVAEGRMLEGQIGLVTIKNFNDKCASETIAAIDELVEQGAKAIIFDVRGNPGGSVDELTKILDHILPEGEIFHSKDRDGTEEIITSDADEIDLPMAVLVNGESYSAAEFFAAALSEYDRAFIVGEHTVGKGFYQYTYQLSDGSAVVLSSGRYYTPNGVNLAEVGGLDPDIPLELTDEQRKLLSYGRLDPAEDPQIQAAIDKLGIS